MTLSVFFAVLFAAALHAVWNALLKASRDKTLNMTAVVLGHAPAAALAIALSPPPAPASYPYLATGAALHVGYQFFLLRAYRAGDLTQVYPLARGAAPLIIAAVSIAALGVTLSAPEALAIFIIAAGLMSLVIVRRAEGALNIRAAALALAAGGFIAAYSLNDGIGARAAGTSLGFYGWLAILNAIVFGLIAAVRRPDALRRLPAEGRAAFFIGGTASFAAYAIVTWGFTQAPIAVVSALRETSIVFALLIGVVFLRERLDLAKLSATFPVLVGAAVLRLAGRT